MFNKISILWRKYPMIANSAICGTLLVGAEFCQQIMIKKVFAQPKEPMDTKILFRYTIYGNFIYGPIVFNWYKFLDGNFPGTARNTIIKKMFLDQLGITPFMIVAFYSATAIMEGTDDIFKELRSKFVPTFTAACYFWIPMQIINFIFVPPRFRVVYVSSCAFMWSNMLCWFKRQVYEVKQQKQEMERKLPIKE